MGRTAVVALVIPERCYRCGALTYALVGVLAEPAGRTPFFMEFDRVAEAAERTIPATELRRLGIGEIKERVSRARGTYLANGCVECDAILGTFGSGRLWTSFSLREAPFGISRGLAGSWSFPKAMNRLS